MVRIAFFLKLQSYEILTHENITVIGDLSVGKKNKKITGSKEIDATALLEYYQPLITWLEEQNTKNNAYIGWDGFGKTFTEYYFLSIYKFIFTIIFIFKKQRKEGFNKKIIMKTCLKFRSEIPKLRKQIASADLSSETLAGVQFAFPGFVLCFSSFPLSRNGMEQSLNAFC